jgi:thiol-disulfide isomerase/thioredoxin
MRTAAALIPVALAIGFAGGGCGRETPADAGATAPASAARVPAAADHVVVVADLDAIARRIGATGARLTVVNFWATWCGPCVAEMPDLLASVAALRDRQVALLLVSYDLNTPGSGLTRETVVPLVRKFVEAHHFDADVLIYDGDTPKLDERFDLPGPIPATILVDAKGNVVARHAGPQTRAEFDRFLGDALAK